MDIPGLETAKSQEISNNDAIIIGISIKIFYLSDVPTVRAPAALALLLFAPTYALHIPTTPAVHMTSEPTHVIMNLERIKMNIKHVCVAPARAPSSETRTSRRRMLANRELRRAASCRACCGCRVSYGFSL